MYIRAIDYIPRNILGDFSGHGYILSKFIIYTRHKSFLGLFNRTRREEPDRRRAWRKENICCVFERTISRPQETCRFRGNMIRVCFKKQDVGMWTGFSRLLAGIEHGIILRLLVAVSVLTIQRPLKLLMKFFGFDGKDKVVRIYLHSHK
jgi:hypothetical protein